VATPADDEQFGAELPNSDQIASYGKCVPPGALAAQAGLSTTPPPAATIPPTVLPPVQAQGTTQAQGSPGSCEVWSAGYAMGSYTANIVNQESPANLNNAVSPGFLYPWVLNEEGKTCGMSTVASDTLDFLVLNTAPSLATVPYSPSCACLDMVDIDQSFATDLRIGSWCYLDQSATDALAVIKSSIAQGRVAQISIFVPWEFGHYTAGVFDAPTRCPTPAPTAEPFCAQHGAFACVASTTTQSGCAQHGIAVIGYDDALVGPDGNAGALQIMNSFGPTWGESGFMWMSYATFTNIYLAGTIAFPPAPSAAFDLSAFQWVEERGEDVPRTHLVVEVALLGPVSAAEIVMDTPDLQRVHQSYAHPFSHGYFFFTRHDGKQFTPGNYRFEVCGTGGQQLGGDRLVDLDPASTLPAAPVPGDATGSNGQPVTIDPAPTPATDGSSLRPAVTCPS
jgi:hypothetical protein